MARRPLLRYKVGRGNAARRDLAMTMPILLDLPMPIVTPRLTIRPAMPGDGAAAHEAIEETFEQLQPWMPWVKQQRDLPTTEASVREAYAKFILTPGFSDARVRARWRTAGGVHGSACA
jgi:hypothetical protein